MRAAWNKAEVDREEPSRPAGELNVSGTTFIMLLNNPSALSQPDKNRIISSVGSWRAGRDGADNPCDLRCISAGVTNEIRTKHQVHSLTFRPDGIALQFKSRLQTLQKLGKGY